MFNQHESELQRSKFQLTHLRQRVGDASLPMPATLEEIQKEILSLQKLEWWREKQMMLHKMQIIADRAKARLLKVGA